MMATEDFLDEMTPTQRRLWEVLKDGERHSREELHGCLWDEMGPATNVRMHLSNMRDILAPAGLDIVCVFWRRSSRWYRLVRHVNGTPKRPGRKDP